MEAADARVSENNVAGWVSTNENDVIAVIVVVENDADVLDDGFVLENC